jgi:3-hydroxybutyryl-CoA dehydratase
MLEVGDSGELAKVITEEDVYLFAGITGDQNPLHISQEYAAKTRFGERIAHGMLTAGLISAVFGMVMPGPGCVYLSQNLIFLAPVKIGDEITARVELVEIIEERRYRMKTQCFNQRTEMVLDGEAVVAVPKPGNATPAGDHKAKEDHK